MRPWLSPSAGRGERGGAWLLMLLPAPPLQDRTTSSAHEFCEGIELGFVRITQSIHKRVLKYTCARTAEKGQKLLKINFGDIAPTHEGSEPLRAVRRAWAMGLEYMGCEDKHGLNGRSHGCVLLASFYVAQSTQECSMFFFSEHAKAKRKNYFDYKFRTESARAQDKFSFGHNLQQ